MIYLIWNGRRCECVLSRPARWTSWWRVWRPIRENWNRRMSTYFQLLTVPLARPAKYWRSQPRDMQTLIILQSWRLFDYSTKSNQQFIYNKSHKDLSYNVFSLEYKELYGARYTSGWMLFRKISATHPNIHCSTNFWLFASNTQRTVNSISK